MKTRIKELRQENKYTQETLAAKAGINQTALSRIECGLTIPDADLLIRLSDIFQVSTDYLLYRCDHPSGTELPDHIVRHIKLYQTQLSLLQRLNPSQRIHLQHFLESIEAIY